MKPVLILQNQSNDGPAYLATWLEKYSIEYKVFNLGNDEKFPQSIEPYAAIAILGGAMSANDPLLSNKQAEILILQAIYYDIPVLGHCLGGQLMSRALGGVISESTKPEIGWQPINWLDDSLTKECFGNDPAEYVHHWHYESFSIPTGAKLLATSDACKNQAFAIGKHLAMQFHIEVDKEKIIEWANEISDNWTNAIKNYDTVQDKNEILTDIDNYLEKHYRTADSVFNYWLKTTDWVQNFNKS